MGDPPAKKKRPNRPTGTAGVRLDGDMLLSMQDSTQNAQLVVAPTAKVEDYDPPDALMVAHNKNKIQARKTEMGAGVWQDDHGVWRMDVKNSEGLASQAHQEFRELFRDGWLSLKAEKEMQASTVIKGGWLKPYNNTLSCDHADQAKSVLAISRSSWTSVKKHMPYLNEVVDLVKDTVMKQLVDKDRRNLKMIELTFFCGTFQASCTQFHRDTDEHPGDGLVFTTLTLLTAGKTSMCVAGKEETWLCKPFDTVCFDPDLYHRSGETSQNVVKLSIHWREVRGDAAQAEQDKGGTSADSPDLPVKIKIEKQDEEKVEAKHTASDDEADAKGGSSSAVQVES